MLQKIYDNSPRNEELSQAVARVVIMGIVTLMFIGVAFYRPAVNTGVVFAGSYFLFALIWLAFIKWVPHRFPVRRYVSIFSDLGIASIGMYSLDAYGAALYPLYLWIIVGNGMRFGQKYLLVAMVIGVTGFGVAQYYTTYWQHNEPMGIGLLTGMIILPLFYLVLIRRLHQAIEHAQFAASHDAMTGLVNRSHFIDRLEYEVDRSERYGNQFCVFYIDLDDFKKINDTYGHQQGDEVLISVANRLLSVVRASDMVARLGGDEFAVLTLSLKGQTAIEQLAVKLIDSLSEPIVVQGQPLCHSASLGVSSYPTHGVSVNALMNAADHAMYRAKHSGKNSYSLCLQASVD